MMKLDDFTNDELYAIRDLAYAYSAEHLDDRHKEPRQRAKLFAKIATKVDDYLHHAALLE